jgi:hypothetical protein
MKTIILSTKNRVYSTFIIRFVTVQVRCASLDFAYLKTGQICCPKVRCTSEGEQLPFIIRFGL